MVANCECGQGRRDPGRKLLQTYLSLGDDLRDCSVDVSGRSQKRFEHCNSVPQRKHDERIKGGQERVLLSTYRILFR